MSFSRGVSDDGTAAAVTAGFGNVAVVPSNQAYLWSAGGGLTALQDYGQGSTATAISADGKTIAGQVTLNNQYGSVHAALWDASGKLHDLGTVNGNEDLWTGAIGLSADGKVVVGWEEMGPGPINYISHAFRWTAAGRYQDLGTLVAGGSSEARAVSGDGSVIAGVADINVPGGQIVPTGHAFLWTLSSNKMTDLGAIGGASTNSTAWGISRDGNVIVGGSEVTSGGAVHAVSWTQTGTIRDLGVLSGTTNSVAMATNGDGSIIVGTSVQGTSGIAFRWTQASGMQNLNTLLANAGVNMNGISLGAALAISANGQFIAGGPYFGLSGREGVTLPAPATVTGDAWLVRYCDALCSGGAPFGGVTTAESQQKSVNQVAKARSTVLAQQNAMVAPLLGDGQRIGFLASPLSAKEAPTHQTGEVGSFIMVGSLEGGAFARFDTRYGFSVLGGLAYQRETFQGAQMQPSLLAALAVRYVYDGFGWVRPIAEAGGWAVPDAALSFSRNYENGAGTATVRANTNGNLEYYYGRLGAAVAAGLSNEIVLTGEIGRELLNTGSFAEAASQGDPFNANGNGASDSAVIGRLRLQFSHAFTPDIDAAVWGAAAGMLDDKSNFAASIAGFGAFAPEHTSQAVWAEYGARLGYRLPSGANIDILASGASGDGVGTLVHVGAALRYNF